MHSIYWSIAQTKNRETEASGMGWELFRNYVIARDKLAPDYFLYENNKSMSPKIREQITAMLGVEPVCINSALVSAQNRQRLYWVGRRNASGGYDPIAVEQPEDRGILLRDVPETTVAEKAYALAEPLITTPGGKSFAVTTRDCGAIPEDTLKRHRHTMVAEPVNITEDGKSQTIKAQYAKNSVANFVCYTSTYGATGVVEPVRVDDMPNGKGETNGAQSKRIYSVNGKSTTLIAHSSGGNSDTSSSTGLYAVPLEYSPFHDCDVVVTDTNIRCTRSDGSGTAQGYTVYFDDVKAPTVSAGHACKMKVIQPATGKEFPVYEVRDGQITIKGKQYPIKLADGWYIIRKLTVRECMRLQTVPETFEFPVSDSQAYKMLGNGWTVDVIAHIMSHFEGITTEPLDVLSMYDGMACGHIALNNLGANIRNYYATEIDKYAIATATHNFPDIVELGDAFQVRKDNWSIAPMADIRRSAIVKRPTPRIVEKLGQMSLFEVGV